MHLQDCKKDPFLSVRKRSLFYSSKDLSSGQVFISLKYPFIQGHSQSYRDANTQPVGFFVTDLAHS